MILKRDCKKKISETLYNGAQTKESIFKMADSSGIDSTEPFPRVLLSTLSLPDQSKRLDSFNPSSIPTSPWLANPLQHLSSLLLFSCNYACRPSFRRWIGQKKERGVHLSPLLSVHQSAFRFSAAINPFNDHPLNG